MSRKILSCCDWCATRIIEKGKIEMVVVAVTITILSNGNIRRIARAVSRN